MLSAVSRPGVDPLHWAASCATTRAVAIKPLWVVMLAPAAETGLKPPWAVVGPAGETCSPPGPGWGGARALGDWSEQADRKVAGTVCNGDVCPGLWSAAEGALYTAIFLPRHCHLQHRVRAAGGWSGPTGPGGEHVSPAGPVRFSGRSGFPTEIQT